MGQVNIYKINPQKHRDFLARLKRDFEKPQVKKISKSSITYELAFYYKAPDIPNVISWKWIFDAYEIDAPRSSGAPKGVLVITSNNSQTTYAVTFGTAFFCVDKFCDRDFGFDYACRVPYSNIRLTALTNPCSVRNKTINSYQNYDKLDFDSGESFAKIKGKIDPHTKEDIIKDTIEVGTALKFQLKEDSLDNTIKLILHIERILSGKKQTSIPRFNLVKDKVRISRLQDNLISAIKKQLSLVIVSEFRIIGSREVFNRYDSYQLSYKHCNDMVPELNLQSITAFCEKYNVVTSSEWLNIKVGFMEDGERKDQTTLLSILDFMDEDERCLLIQGEWYEFNDDYLEYLKNSLSEIPVLYDPCFDLSHSQLEKFQAQKANEEKDDVRYKGQDFDAIKKSMKTKYYAERAFNEMRKADGFDLGDRQLLPVGEYHIEVWDLYKDNAIFSVKRGKSSADFSYVVAQSLMAVKAYKSGSIPSRNVKKIVIWLIFERSQTLPLKGTKLDWDSLNMLILKNRLDQWKKEVRLAGFEPEIWINYQTKD